MYIALGTPHGHLPRHSCTHKCTHTSKILAIEIESVKALYYKPTEPKALRLSYLVRRPPAAPFSLGCSDPPKPRLPTKNTFY